MHPIYAKVTGPQYREVLEMAPGKHREGTQPCHAVQRGMAVSTLKKRPLAMPDAHFPITERQESVIAPRVRSEAEQEQRLDPLDMKSAAQSAVRLGAKSEIKAPGRPFTLERMQSGLLFPLTASVKKRLEKGRDDVRARSVRAIGCAKRVSAP